MSGTPTTAGDYSVNVTVTDSYATSVSSSASASISSAALPVIQSASISSTTGTATQNSAYSQTFTISCSPTDAFHHATWNSLSGDSAGLTLTKNGASATVSGTPTSTGTVKLTGFAYDSYGNYKSATATITINAAPVTYPVLSSATWVNGTATFTQNTAGSTTLTFTLVDPDDGSYSYSTPKLTGNAAAGLTATCDKDGMVISGTPTTAGTAYCDVTISNHAGNKKGLEATITVNAPVEKGKLIPANCSLPQIPEYDGESNHYETLAINLDEDDDGTYTYVWTFNGNGIGYGNMYFGSDHSKPITSGSSVKGADSV